MKPCALLFFCLFMLQLPAGERVVALSPGAAEMFLTLGIKEVLCARCSACRFSETTPLPVAGSMGMPSPETVFRLHATMIVTDVFWPSNSWRAVERAGVRIVRLPSEKLSDYPANLRTLGAIFHREAVADEAAARYESEIEALAAASPARKRKVLLVFSVSPAVSCGEKSFLTQSLRLAGAESITAKIPGNYFTVSPEVILAGQPEIVLAVGIPEQAVRAWFSRPEYRTLPAVRHDRFMTLDPDLFSRSGPRFPEALRELKARLDTQNECPPRVLKMSFQRQHH